MKVLVIGNGFDLAHGLKTSYKNFLTFIKCVLEKDKWLNKDNAVAKDYPIEFVDYISSCCKAKVPQGEEKDFVQEITGLIKDNLWIEHFMSAQIKENWVDFEKEISRIIQYIDGLRTSQPNEGMVVFKALELFDSKSFENLGEMGIHSLSELRDRLLRDLEELVLALELYLVYYVEGVQLKTINGKRNDIEKLGCGKIISFNYTNTYEVLYGERIPTQSTKYIIRTEEYSYIHGRAKKEFTTYTCNLVLGIDEYLKDSQKDEDNYFIEFKKFFQRIYKKTGCDYKKWLSYLKQNNDRRKDLTPEKLEVYFYGHSLDVTDGDIIKDLIRFENAQTTIFYYDREALAKYISNLVKILGEDELVARTGEDNKSIFFVPINPDEFETTNVYY